MILVNLVKLVILVNLVKLVILVNLVIHFFLFFKDVCMCKAKTIILLHLSLMQIFIGDRPIVD